MKRLIVNADDFGITRSVNRGIIHGFKNGIITSASLMVKRPYAQEAAKLAKENPGLGMGLHFELTADKKTIKLVRKIMNVNDIYEIEKEITTVFLIRDGEKEFYEQIKLFKKLMERLPDHIDGHYHVHLFKNFRPFILDFSKKHKIPLRILSGVSFIEKFSDTAETATVENLTRILKNLPEGISELLTHPGYVRDDLRQINSRVDERGVELKTLTSPKIKKVIKEEGIELISWRDVIMF